jgi:hypothetical protein
MIELENDLKVDHSMDNRKMEIEKNSANNSQLRLNALNQ